MKDFFIFSIVFGFLYLWLGKVARDEFIERGWIRKDLSLFMEIFLAPIFTLSGMLLFVVMVGALTTISVICVMPVIVPIGIFLYVMGFI